jgi:hypothetical protein
MRLIICKVAFLVIVLSGLSLFAQIPLARFQISGTTAKAGSLLLASASGVAASQAPMGRQVQVRLRPTSGSRAVTVPLIARSNAPYRLLVKSIPPQDGGNPQPIRIVLTSVNPNAGTTHLTADAVNVRAVEGQVAGIAGATIVEGPRISNGGTDATADNALRLVFEAELPEALSEAELTFTMELY